MILSGIVGLIVILIAVLEGVPESKHNNSSTTSQSSPSNSSPSSPTVAPTQRNIAAIFFTSNSTNEARVYFQDNFGQISEASNLAGSTTWRINKTDVSGKNGSAIAAAMTRPGFPLVGITHYFFKVKLILLTSS